MKILLIFADLLVLQHFTKAQGNYYLFLFSCSPKSYEIAC